MLPPKAPGKTAVNLEKSQIPKPGQSDLTSVEVHPVPLLTETTTLRSSIQSPALSVAGQLEASSSSGEHCELDLDPENAVGCDVLRTEEPLMARMRQAPVKPTSEMSSTSPPPVINPERQPDAAEHQMALDHIAQPQPQELAEAPASGPAPLQQIAPGEEGLEAAASLGQQPATFSVARQAQGSSADEVSASEEESPQQGLNGNGPAGAQNEAVTFGQVAHEIREDDGNLTRPDHIVQAIDDQVLLARFK